MEESHMSREILASFKNLLTSVVFIWNHKIAVVSKLYLLSSSFLPQPLFYVAVIPFLMETGKVCEKRKQKNVKEARVQIRF